MIQAFESNWITTMGPQVDMFEKEMCEKIGAGYAAALSSGTAALHLAMILLGIQPGDEVVCSDLTFASTANAIVYCGARPVFIDSDRLTWNMDPQLLADELATCAKNGRKPKAVIPVDLYGQCADYDLLLDICSRHGIPVVEDAAEALGATYKDRYAGNFGEMGVLSFNGNKIITTSGGGMLVSHDKSYIEKARHLATQARDNAPHYQHSKIGYNYRMSNILAAIGRGQLEGLEQKVAKRRAVNSFYRQALADMQGIEFLPEAPFGRSNNWLTVIIISPEEGMNREKLRIALGKENIEARPVWKPMHLQPVFQECRIRGGIVSEDLFAKGLCLPSGDELTDDQLQRIVSIIRKCRQ